MFADWLDPILTRCPRPLRAMGYFNEVRGIRSRYQRCKEHWAEHIQRTRSVVIRAMERCPQRRKAVVLGGGLMHDLPLEELSAGFKEVVLVDLVHPFHSRWATRHLPNVKRLPADITATAESVYRLAWEAHLPLPTSRPMYFIGDAELDLTVSVNLLSQLPCMPTSYLTQQGAHSRDKIDAFARHLIEAHLDYLGRLPGAVALVTDVERLKINMMRQVVERRDLMLGVPLPKPGEEWEWKLAPCPEADPRHHYYRRVVGIVDFK